MFAGLLAVIATIAVVVLYFFLINGITAGLVWLVLYFGLPLFPQFTMPDFWQIFVVVALLRIVGGFFKSETKVEQKRFPWER